MLLPSSRTELWEIVIGRILILVIVSSSKVLVLWMESLLEFFTLSGKAKSDMVTPVHSSGDSLQMVRTVLFESVPCPRTQGVIRVIVTKPFAGDLWWSEHVSNICATQKTFRRERCDYYPDALYHVWETNSRVRGANMMAFYQGLWGLFTRVGPAVE